MSPPQSPPIAALLAAIHNEVRPLGTADHLRVERMLVVLGRGRERVPRAELRASLASLLATDKGEWTRIAALFDAYVPGGDDAASSVEVVLAPVIGGGGAGRNAPPVIRPVRWWHRAPLIAIAVVAVALPPDSKPISFESKPKIETPVRDPERLLDCKQEALSRTTELVPLGGAEAMITTQRKVAVPPTGADFAVFALSALLVALAVRLGRLPHASRVATKVAREREAAARTEAAKARREASRRERLRLEEAFARGRRALRLEYHVPRLPAVSPAAIDACATILSRVRGDMAGEDLDVRATIDATAKSGGQAQAIFEPSVASRPVLVLVDRGAGGSHPWLGGFERVLERLGRRGVRFDRYDFRSNPDDLVPSPDTGARPTFAAVARRHGGTPLILFSPRPQLRHLGGRRAPWLDRIDAFPLRAWIDPDPRPDRRRTRFREVRETLAALGFVRFDLDDAHLIAVVRFVAAAGVGVRPPPCRPLPDARRPEVAEALRQWATLCALVPDANWDQVEAARRTPEIREHLGERRHVSLLLDWIGQQPEQARIGREEHTRHIELSQELERRLVAEQARIDAASGLPREQHLGFRGRQLLLKQLGDAPPDDPYLLHHWKLKRAAHNILLEPDRARELIESLRDTPLVTELVETVEAAFAAGAEDLWDPVTKRVARAVVETTAALADTPLPPGPRGREVVLGHRSLWCMAGAAGVAVGGVFAIALWVGGASAPLAGLFTVEVTERVQRQDTRELYQVHVGASAQPATAERPAMVTIPGGTYPMGSPQGEKDRDPDERQHPVTVSRFAIAETEVTQGQYAQVMGDNPSRDKKCGKDCPVETVSWLNAARYCNKLSERERIPKQDWCYDDRGGDDIRFRGRDCKSYRLPTEAEWEWAARGGCAGVGKRFVGTDDEKDVCAHDNVADKGSKYPFFDCTDLHPELAPVRQYTPNAFGLYDMGGNVWEWVNDWYQFEYEKLPSVNPIGPPSPPDGTLPGRSYRGGSWNSDPLYARAAGRWRDDPSGRNGILGFRVARSLP